MKKYLIVLTVIIITGFIFTGCREDSENSNQETICAHDWGTWAVATAPTCTTTGVGISVMYHLRRN